MPVVDLVLHGGLVHDGDRVVPGATAVAVDRGRVVAVGSDADVRARVGPVTHLVDLAGRPVLPGFTDAHVHPVMGGLERLACDVSGATTVEQTLHLVRQHALAHPDAEWLDGGGWHKEPVRVWAPDARPARRRGPGSARRAARQQSPRRLGEHRGTARGRAADRSRGRHPARGRDGPRHRPAAARHDRAAAGRAAGGAASPALAGCHGVAGRDRRRVRGVRRPDARLPRRRVARAAHGARRRRPLVAARCAGAPRAGRGRAGWRSAATRSRARCRTAASAARA
nr:amidohydrolase family protein [Angustibacter aerolatus]